MSLLGWIGACSELHKNSLCCADTVTMMRDIIMCLLSAKDKGEKKLFGFAFTPLMREDGTTLSDESHELYVYKVHAGLTYIC